MRNDMDLMQQLTNKTDSNYLCYLNYYDKSTNEYGYGRATKNTNRPGTQFSDGQDTKFVSNTQSEKAKFNKMLQARIQGSNLLKSFQDSRTPMENLKIWKFEEEKNFKKIGNIFVIFLH